MDKSKKISIIAIVLFIIGVSFLTGVLFAEKIHLREFKTNEITSMYNINIYDKYEKFNNQQGTPISKCIEINCDKYIATNGDTLYCESHSELCKLCGKYINKSEKFCMECRDELLYDIFKSKFL